MKKTHNSVNEVDMKCSCDDCDKLMHIFEEACRDCIYWDMLYDEDNYDVLGNKVSTTRFGCCRYNPPTSDYSWPLTEEWDRCGRFEAAPC